MVSGTVSETDAEVTGATTVTIVEALHAPDIYEMVLVPRDMPVTIPLLMPIVATVVVLLVHVPAPTGSVRSIVPPMHTKVGPEMAVVVTVTIYVA